MQLLRWGWRGVLILAVGFLALGGLAYAVGRPNPEAGARAARWCCPSCRASWASSESAIVINAVNVLFALFVLIQLPYLFGGQLNIAEGASPTPSTPAAGSASWSRSRSWCWA